MNMYIDKLAFSRPSNVTMNVCWVESMVTWHVPVLNRYGFTGILKVFLALVASVATHVLFAQWDCTAMLQLVILAALVALRRVP